AVDRASYATFWGMDAGDDNSAIAFQLGPDGILQLSSDSGTSQDLFAPTVGTWYCYALSRSAASSSAGTLQVRYGTSPGSLTSAAPSSTGEWAQEAAFTRLFLGESPWRSGWLDGTWAAVKVSTRALSDAEIAAALSCYAPVSTDGLYAAYPFWDGPSTADASGTGRTLSGGSGTSAESGPGIPFEPTVEPEQAPGDVFDLTSWKITLPTEDPEDPGDADEVTQPELNTYADEHFYLDGSDR